MTATTIIDPRRQTGPLAVLRNVGALAWRGLVQIKHNPLELVDLSIQPIMFLLLFVFIFGGQMAGSSDNYLQYALAGLIVQNSAFMGLYTAMGLHSDVEKGVFDRFRSLPIGRSAPLLGRILGDLAKQVWGIALMLLLGVIMGFNLDGGVSGTLAMFGLLMLFALALSWLNVFIGMVGGKPEQVNMYGMVIIMPLTFGSSAFVKPETLPGFLEWWAGVNPVSTMSDAVRALLNGEPATGQVGMALVLVAAIAAIFFPLAMRAYRRRLS